MTSAVGAPAEESDCEDGLSGGCVGEPGFCDGLAAVARIATTPAGALDAEPSAAAGSALAAWVLVEEGSAAGVLEALFFALPEPAPF